MTSNKIEALVHLIGCQAYDVGYNEGVSGDDSKSMDKVEELEAEAIKSLNKTYLELVLEIIGDIEQRETEDMSLLSWTPEDYKVFGKNELKIELRNALNQRLGEEQ